MIIPLNRATLAFTTSIWLFSGSKLTSLGSMAIRGESRSGANRLEGVSRHVSESAQNTATDVQAPFMHKLLFKLVGQNCYSSEPSCKVELLRSWVSLTRGRWLSCGRKLLRKQG